MEPPFGSGYTPEQESQKLANKGYRSYQQALYYQSLGTPKDAANPEPRSKRHKSFCAKRPRKTKRMFAPSTLRRSAGDARRTCKAIGAFTFALQLSPKYFDAWLSRAKILLDMGLLSDVQKSYDVLARNEPTWQMNCLQPSIFG